MLKSNVPQMESLSSQKFHPTLPLDTNHYQKCYQTFSQFMDCAEPYEPWYNQVLGITLRDKLGAQAVAATPADDVPLRHMGVGSGSGELERAILLALLSKFKRIQNCVVEPSDQQISRYKALVKNDHELSAAVDFDWRQQTLEAYQCERKERHRFNVITVVHSIYYGDRMEDKVPYLLNLLTDGGVAAFVLISETDSLSKVQSEVLSTDIPGYRYYTKEKLQTFLDSIELQCDTIDIPRFNINVTPCFDNSVEGALLLDFLSHMKHFRTEVSPEMQERFLSLLRQNAHVVGNRLMVTHDTSAVIVQRMTHPK